LERAWTEAKLPSEREHVTPYIWNHPELFKIETVNYERDLSTLRWAVDEPRDLEFVRRVYHELGENMFYMEDVLLLLERHPEIGAINSDIVRNSGYYKSLREESTSEHPQPHSNVR
jgi:spore coat polysaccharide biosynthesis protein SpsF (cytidylyltransferase family)